MYVTPSLPVLIFLLKKINLNFAGIKKFFTRESRDHILKKQNWECALTFDILS